MVIEGGEEVALLATGARIHLEESPLSRIRGQNGDRMKMPAHLSIA